MEGGSPRRKTDAVTPTVVFTHGVEGVTTADADTRSLRRVVGDELDAVAERIDAARHAAEISGTTRGLNVSRARACKAGGGPEHLGEFDQLYVIRPGAESINRWIKQRFNDNRAPAVGREDIDELRPVVIKEPPHFVAGNDGRHASWSTHGEPVSRVTQRSG